PLHRHLLDSYSHHIDPLSPYTTLFRSVGNVFNQYLDYNTPQETFNLIKTLFSEQETWGKNRLSQIPHIAKDYGLSLQSQNRKQADRKSTRLNSSHLSISYAVFY